MAPPATMKAFKTGQRSWLSIAKNGVTKQDLGHGAAVYESVPTPKLDPDEILVKVHAVAQNPTDWKHIVLISPPHSIIGCDFAGEVADIGPQVPEGAWKLGERAAGVAHGGLYKDQGAFAQYVKIPYDLAWKTPSSISDREATTYGVSGITSMMALYHNLAIPWPDTSPPTSSGTILIYAGSTCSGIFAIQMAKHAGWRVITTCSPSNFDLVKSYGADAAFDYRSKTLVADIKSAHPDITRAMDCFSAGQSTTICDQVLTPAPSNPNDVGNGRVITLLPGFRRKVNGIENKTILAYTLTGREFQWFPPFGPKYKAVPEDRAALKRFCEILPKLAEAWLKPTPVQFVEGGWDGIATGLELLKQGKVSGKKLVLDLD